ncbi:hypothetical protein IEQ34_017614 [Dendrobium chrysotoxum]|uniref:Core domain-containing protein n=1 Tax=Dendrobium chrysotoxum TaxID=161865 RepID=A0AAV7GC58_DENCH|nr:hypothetical protein IEQ34_017614 [Dendrobium chrysotoxum]
MAEPEWDYGLVHDDRDQIDILQSPFFDVCFDFDDTVEEYIDRIQYTLVDVIDEQRSKGRWIITGRPPSSIAPATSPHPVKDYVDRILAILADTILKQLVCDPKSLLYVYGMQLDFSDALIGGGFSFKNPNATKTCGCGKSFAAAGETVELTENSNHCGS